MSEVPAMTEILGADAPTNWGKWGPDDELGALNYLDAAEVLRGVQHIKSGETFTLQIQMGRTESPGDPLWPGREGIQRRTSSTSPAGTARALPRSPAACTTPTTPRGSSCRAPRSTTRSATSGTTASSGTASTPAPPSAPWRRPPCSPSPKRASSGLDHRVHRPDERPGRREEVPRDTHQDLLRWGTHPAVHGGRVQEHVRDLHPQHLRPHRDHLAVARHLLGTEGPVDEASGALSVGVPTYDTIVQIVDDEGNDLPVGEIGELVTTGPQVVAGYWNKPEETAKALPGGSLHTGDVGYMDAEGWFYIVDRKKDQINAGGYKVWPREVEDVLYEHEAVREAAVVGVPDEYRGETVKAFVSLRPGKTVSEADLIAFTKERMAAYKYPRQIEFLDEVPKTVTGKVLRRELRGRQA